MKLHQLRRFRVLKEANDSYLFHATFNKHVPGIVKKGLRQFETSNWVKGPGGTRYNEDAGIFAFEHPEDALRWGLKMQWDFKTDDVSIVRINRNGNWEQDPSADASLAFGKGQSMRSQFNVPASDIIDVFPIEDFGHAGPRNMSMDEWLADSAKKLLQ